MSDKMVKGGRDKCAPAPVRNGWLRTAGLLLGVVALPLDAAAQHIRLISEHAVDIGLEDRVLVYPHLAVHPARPDHLVGAVWSSVPGLPFEEQAQHDRCATILSTDGGRTWRRHDFDYTGCGDPWVGFTADGSALFTAMVDHPAVPAASDNVVVHRSTDGGASWAGTAVHLGAGHDHPTLVVDQGSTGLPGWVYLVSSVEGRFEEGAWRAGVFVARSRNGGGRFDFPTLVRPNNLWIKAETAVVLSDGSLVISYVEGATAPHSFRYFPSRRAWVIRSRDGGQTFSPPLFVNDACGPMPEQRFSLSSLVAGPRGTRFRDRLYFACNATGGGGILLHYSADGGETWTEPQPVHTAPVDPAVRRRLMGAAVDARGVLGIVWSDFRHSSGACYDVYFTATTDGGATFHPEVRLTSDSSCYDPAVAGGTVPWRDGGAYWGLAADDAGRFRLLWPDARTGTYRLRFATVEVALPDG